VTDDRRDDDMLDLPLGAEEETEPEPRDGSPRGLGIGPRAESASGEEMWDRLDREAPAGERPLPPAKAARRRSRTPFVVMVVLVVVLLLVFAVVVGYLLPRPSPAVVRAEPSILDFGARSVGVPGDALEILLTSSGERPARIDEVTVTAPADGAAGAAASFRVASDACSGSTLAPEKGCAVAVVFEASGTGSRKASLVIAGDFANGPMEIPLLGEGVAPHLLVDRRTIEFGSHEVGARAVSEVVTIENDGTAPLTLAGVTVGGPGADDYTVSAAACTREPLAPGRSCPVSVAFSPTAEGQRQALLDLRPGTAIRGVELPRVALVGTGVPSRLAGLVIEGPSGPLDDGLGFGTVYVGGAASDRAVRLLNRGDEPLRLSDVGVEGGGGAFSVSANGCPASGELAVGEGCEITVRFAAAADGPAEGLLSVGLAEAARRIEVPLTGVAVTARLVPRPTAVDFGESRVGEDGPTREVVYASTGTGAVEVASMVAAGADPGAFLVRTDTCSGKTLAPGESCRFAVTFHPRQEGVQSARVEVGSPVLSEPPAVSLSGAGAAPRIGLETRTLKLGRVAATRSASRSLTVRSAGRAPLEVRRLEVTGDGASAFEIEREDCTEPLALAPGDTCRVSVRFAPRPEEGEGPRRAALLIVHDGGDSPARVALEGLALPAPAPRFGVSPGRLRLGTVAVGGRSTIETVTVRNQGSDRLVLSDVALAGPDAGEFRIVSGSCDGAAFITPGSECTIGVRFTPGQAGLRRAELVIRHNATGGVGRVALEGVGSGE